MPRAQFEDVPFLTDWKGDDYRVGDRIYYARASGRSNEICEGEVVAIKRKVVGVNSWDQIGATTVHVMPLRSSRFRWGVGELDTWKMHQKTASKPVILSVLENVTRIPDSVPRFVPLARDTLELITVQEPEYSFSGGRRLVTRPGIYTLRHTKTGTEVTGETTDDLYPRALWEQLLERLYVLVPPEKR